MTEYIKNYDKTRLYTGMDCEKAEAFLGAYVSGGSSNGTIGLKREKLIAVDYEDSMCPFVVQDGETVFNYPMIYILNEEDLQNYRESGYNKGF